MVTRMRRQAYKPKAHETFLAKYAYTSNGPNPSVEMIIKAIRKKKNLQRTTRGSMSQQQSNIQIEAIKCKGNQNDGHPSYDHGLKFNTFLADPH